MEIDESNPTVTLEDSDSLQTATLEAEQKDTAADKTEHMEESMKADETNSDSRKSAKDNLQETLNLSAKPKAISIDQSITRTAYDTCFFGDRKTPCQVEIHPDSGVKLNDTFISLDDLRYASKQQYKGFPDRAMHCVVLSYNDQAERDVNDRFLEMDTLDDTSELLEDFLKLFKSKFLVMEQENDSSIDKDCYGIIVDQPIYFGKVDIKVSEMEGDATVVYEGHSIVVLDIECLALYPVVNNKLGTPYRLMFWQDEGPQSVEKILHYHKEQKIAFSTTSHTFEMPVVDSIVTQLHELRPKVKNVLACKPLLKQWLSTNPRTHRSEPHLHARARQPERFTGIQHGAQRGAEGLSEWTEDWTGAGASEEVSRMETLTSELNEAVRQVDTNEAIQMYWISVEADLNAIIDSGAVPETDPFSGGLDPDNVEHLKKALSDVEDQLKEQKFDIAVSRIQAVRKVFMAARAEEIRRFFDVADIEILRKLYFKSLVQ